MEQDMSVTGFSPSEVAKLVPGVLSGKRLTLDNLNERLLKVEGALAAVAKDVYSDAKSEPLIDQAELFATGGYVNGPGALEEANEYLRRVIDEKNKEIERLNDLVYHQDTVIDNLNDKLVAIRSAMGNPEW